MIKEKNPNPYRSHIIEKSSERIASGYFTDNEFDSADFDPSEILLPHIVHFNCNAYGDIDGSNLPSSYRRIQFNQSYYILIELPNIHNANGEPLYMYVPFFTSQNAINNLSKILEGKLKCKRYCSIVDAANPKSNWQNKTRDNFWWDAENDVFMFFGHKQTMESFLAVMHNCYLEYNIKQDQIADYLKYVYQTIILSKGNIKRRSIRNVIKYEVLNEDNLNECLQDLNALYRILNEPIIFIYKGKSYNLDQSSTYCHLTMEQMLPTSTGNENKAYAFAKEPCTN